MHVLGLILFIVHIVAFIAGGANSVVMPIIGMKLAAPTATPDIRATLGDIALRLSTIGKYAMATLLITGVLVLWLKWDWVVPNNWFWAKMFFIVLMLVFIGINEGLGKRARAGDMEAGRRAGRFGQLTALAFLGVIVSAVFAFN
jgi:putative membrane protein